MSNSAVDELTPAEAAARDVESVFVSIDVLGKMASFCELEYYGAQAQQEPDMKRIQSATMAFAAAASALCALRATPEYRSRIAAPQPLDSVPVAASPT